MSGIFEPLKSGISHFCVESISCKFMGGVEVDIRIGFFPGIHWIVLLILLVLVLCNFFSN